MGAKSYWYTPTRIAFGAEFSDSASIIAKHYDIVDGTHGTHVAGIAGGSGVGGSSNNNRKFRGVAYDADLAFVAIYPSSQHWLNTGLTDMLDGMQYIYNYAQSVNKPAVANLSWGGPIGPKDGKSLFSQACNNMTGQGKIFVLSAGNNGSNRIHLKKSFTATDTLVQTISNFSTYLIEKKNLIDIWGDSSKTFCLQFSLYAGNTSIASTNYVCLDDSVHDYQLIGSNGDTCFITISTVANEFNGKPHMLVQLYNKVPDNLCVRIKATSGKINMWQGYVLNTSGYYGSFAQGGYSWAVNGDVNMTISDMVTSASAIGVAAYNSKTTYTSIDGSSYSYPGYTRGAIALFSSRGPTADGRIKPDIAGPGLALASSLSALDSTYFPTGSDYSSVVSQFNSPLNGSTYSYGVAAGTSMSSPAVSGIVALLLQVNRWLAPQELMSILSETAIKDNFTGMLPAAGNSTWGHGKVNAYRAIKKVLETSGIKHFESEMHHYLVYPNPSTGNYNISFNNLENETIQIVVYNVVGEKCFEKNINTTTENGTEELNLDFLKTGTYLMNMISKSGTEYIKISKQ